MKIILTYLAILSSILVINGCSKECDISDFKGTYTVEPLDRTCVPILIEDNVKFDILFDVIPFLIVNDQKQYQISLVTEEDPGGGCGFTFVAPNFPSGESAAVNIKGNNIIITYSKSGSVCEAKLNKK